MTPIKWMVGLSIAGWFVMLATIGVTLLPEVTAGMLAPLVAATTSWAVVARTHRLNPMRVTHVTLQLFIAKLLFFCVYLIVMIRLVALQPTPFALSFAAYFVGLYVTQAVFLRRLLVSSAHVSA